MGLREILKDRDGMSDEEIEKELDFCREMLLTGSMTPNRCRTDTQSVSM